MRSKEKNLAKTRRQGVRLQQKEDEADKVGSGVSDQQIVGSSPGRDTSDGT